MSIFLENQTQTSLTFTNNGIRVFAKPLDNGMHYCKYVVHYAASTGGYPSCPNKAVHASIGKVFRGGAQMWWADSYSYHRGMWNSSYADHIHIQSGAAGDGIYGRMKQEGNSTRQRFVVNSASGAANKLNNTAANLDFVLPATPGNHTGDASTWQEFTLMDIGHATWQSSRIAFTHNPHCGADKVVTACVYWIGSYNGIQPETTLATTTTTFGTAAVRDGTFLALHSTTNDRDTLIT